MNTIALNNLAADLGVQQELKKQQYIDNKALDSLRSELQDRESQIQKSKSEESLKKQNLLQYRDSIKEISTTPSKTDFVHISSEAKSALSTEKDVSTRKEQLPTGKTLDIGSQVSEFDKAAAKSKQSEVAQELLASNDLGFHPVIADLLCLVSSGGEKYID